MDCRHDRETRGERRVWGSLLSGLDEMSLKMAARETDLGELRLSLESGMERVETERLDRLS